MNVVDSPGWLEYFAGGRQARASEPALEEIESLLGPTGALLSIVFAQPCRHSSRKNDGMVSRS